MDMPELKILLVDDDEDTYVLVGDLLSRIRSARYHLDWANSYALGAEGVRRKEHDLYLIDYRLGARDGLSLLREAVAGGVTAPLIMLTGEGNYEIDVQAMTAGASDYLPKDHLILPVLERTLRYALERKRIQRELVEARTGRVKAEFLAVMSHELRTPLNGVLGMSSLLLETEMTDEQWEYADEIHASGDVLLGIINDILDFSRITAGQLKIERKETRIADVVEGAVAKLGEKAVAKQLTIGGTTGRDVPRLLLGDGGRVKQVLSILLNNAIKFTAHGTISAAARLESQTPDRAVVRFEVTDTGVGISRDGQERLFQPFSQVDSSATRRFGGTGLGLAIAKRLVELMGGTIGVNSEAGHGSQFWFTVPLVKTAEAPVPETKVKAALAAIAKAVVGPQDCILIAEDDALNQRIISRMLKKLGYKVHLMANGKEAIEALAKGTQYCALLLDLHMPVMDGIETAQLIRRSEAKGRHLPIIALTADASRETMERCLSAGMDKYLPKPITIEALREALKTLRQLQEEARTNASAA